MSREELNREIKFTRKLLKTIERQIDEIIPLIDCKRLSSLTTRRKNVQINLQGFTATKEYFFLGLIFERRQHLQELNRLLKLAEQEDSPKEK
jgi:hypothetical protein